MDKVKILFVFTFSMVLLILVSCSQQKESTPLMQKIPVKTAAVQQKIMVLPIQTSGKLATKAEMKLSFKVGGIIEAINVDEGETVQQGQILAKLNLSEIKSMLNQAKSAFEKAQRDFTRVERLYADSVVTLEQFQNARTGVEIARSNLNIAEFNHDHAIIKAPVRGKILKRLGEINELINPGMPVFILGMSGSEWILRVGVTDRDLVRLALKDSARVWFDAYPGEKFKAHVVEIAEAADPFTGTYEVELELLTGGKKLISGFVASTKIYPSRQIMYHVIPVEALVEGDQNQGFVYTIGENSENVLKIPIQIDLIAGGEIGVLSGLDNIKEVITDGAPYLNQTSRIQILHN
ncbi:efflux RND transporter periplasmic adaptor subunit [candidate division KSB1 bacterium]|nr:efflux RND transporter periplasmic adaptor subunit [candidate division KSB1 bacterium]